MGLAIVMLFVPTMERVMKTARPIELSSKQRIELERMVRSQTLEVRAVRRAQIVLLAADGMANREIAAALGVGRVQVGRWRERFVQGGVAAIEDDLPRSGRKPRVDRAEIVRLTTQTTPEAATHWSTRTLARKAGVSDTTVLCCDEKSQVQALDRTQPGLPLKRGRAATQTHDYKRHGTTTLFAALNTLDGSVIARCDQHHRHSEWLDFLRQIERETSKGKELHLICDNYATHKHPKVKEWLAKHPRITVHFTPTSASWLNMVERFFRDITTERLRRGVFRCLPDLILAIKEYITVHNQDPKPFVWTAKANDILQKVIRANRRLGSKKNEALH